MNISSLETPLVLTQSSKKYYGRKTLYNKFKIQSAEIIIVEGKVRFRSFFFF